MLDESRTPATAFHGGTCPPNATGLVVNRRGKMSRISRGEVTFVSAFTACGIAVLLKKRQRAPPGGTYRANLSNLRERAAPG